MVEHKVLATVSVQKDPLWKYFGNILDQEIAEVHPRLIERPRVYPLAFAECILAHCLPDIVSVIPTTDYSRTLYLQHLHELTRKNLEQNQPKIADYIHDALCDTRVSYGTKPFLLGTPPAQHAKFAMHGKTFVEEILKRSV